MEKIDNVLEVIANVGMTVLCIVCVIFLWFLIMEPMDKLVFFLKLMRIVETIRDWWWSVWPT